MKLIASSVLLGAASAALPPFQQVLRNPTEAVRPVTDTWSKPLHSLSESFKSLTDEARAIWEDVAMHFPEQMDKASFFSAPKPHVRKPNSAWDYHVKGADIQK